MNIQDKLERILRDMHIMVSRGQAVGEDDSFVMINKKDMQRQLANLSQAVAEMMDQYEATVESRDRAEREAERQRSQIVRNASLEAEDIYAASVLYTDEALGSIQDIIDQAEQSVKEVLVGLSRDMESEKRLLRSNQLELKSQLEGLKDTGKYFKIIEERNREIAREKAKKNESPALSRRSRRKAGEQDEDFVPVTPEIKINEEYFEKAGLTPEGVPKDAGSIEERVYEKPEIKINKDYFIKAGIPFEDDAEDLPDSADKMPIPAEKMPALAEDASASVGEKPISAENISVPAEEAFLPAEDEVGERMSAGTEIGGEFMDPEEEQRLMNDLDLEYFKWRDGETETGGRNQKRRGLLSLGRWEKS